MLLLDLTGGSLAPSSFVTFGASLQSLDAPIVTVFADPSRVPEPGTLLLLGGGLAGVVARRRKERTHLM